MFLNGQALLCLVVFTTQPEVPQCVGQGALSDVFRNAGKENLLKELRCKIDPHKLMYDPHQ